MDEEKKQALLDKIDDGSFSSEDLDDYLELFMEVCNESEDIEEEVDGWDRTFQIKMEDKDDFYFMIEECKFSVKKGTHEDPDITLEMSADTAAGIFSGEIDATSAYMGGELKIIGPLPDAVKFRTLTELVREELEE
ncbi:SCP2 sterol-binding domain-containing protein [Candidatus Lokiarchaeum ossiferum]|uniref:SCP2 sterol-binding domain-containing protein n=1 Tax=Candidatus Lokiarchaeum ossiferum TaxID=2951803 RepID=UPI00352CE489